MKPKHNYRATLAQDELFDMDPTHAEENSYFEYNHGIRRRPFKGMRSQSKSYNTTSKINPSWEDEGVYVDYLAEDYVEKYRL